MPIYTNDPCDDGFFPVEPSLRSSIGIGPKVTKAIDAATKDWLDEHPEATTTVEDNSLTNAKFMDGSVNSRVIEDESITSDDIADLAVTTPKIEDNAVNADKIAASAADGLRIMTTSQLGVAKVGSGLAINNGALELNGGSIAPAVTAWLNDHPEATTTVQDDSITDDKLSKAPHNILYDLSEFMKVFGIEGMNVFTINGGTNHSSLQDYVGGLDIKSGDTFRVSIYSKANCTLYAFPDDPPLTNTGIGLGSFTANINHRTFTASNDIKSLGIFQSAFEEDNNVTIIAYTDIKYVIDEKVINGKGIALDDYVRNYLPHYHAYASGEYDLNTFLDYGHFFFRIGSTFVNAPTYLRNSGHVFLLDVIRIDNTAGMQRLTDAQSGRSWVRYFNSDHVFYEWGNTNAPFDNDNEIMQVNPGEDTDLDNFTDSHIWMFPQTSSASQYNLPTASNISMCLLIVLKRIDNVVTQLAFYPNIAELFTRTKKFNGWTRWSSVGKSHDSIVNSGTFDLNDYIYSDQAFGNSVVLQNGPSQLQATGMVRDLVVHKLSAAEDSATGYPIYQELTDCHNGRKWIRYRQSDGLFYDWKEISGDSASQLTVKFSRPLPYAMSFKNRITRQKIQDIAVYNGHIFDMGTGVMNVDGGEDITISNGHGNNANFGKELHGDFPYLYCGSWNMDDCKVYVNEVSLTGSNLVRTISFPTLSGHLNSVVDEENSKIYILLNKNSSTVVGDIDFIVASLSDGEILSRTELPFAIPVIQGMDFVDGIIYVTHGGAAPYTENHVLTLDTNGNILSNTFDMAVGEIEGISFDGDTMYLSNYAYIYH